MRRLVPTYDESVDLLEEYAFPSEGQWVRANMVSSVDGSAVADGRSEGLSGPADKRIFGVLRGLCDVVLVGAGTARAEGYRAPAARPAHAAARAGAGQRPAPVLALVSGRLDLDPASDLFTGPERTVVITSAAADTEARERLADVADLLVAGDSAVDIGVALDELATRGLAKVLCEGGPHLLADLVGARRLDELCATVAPRLISGEGPRMLTGPPLRVPAELALERLLEEDGNLFARYLVSPG
jgi:riboflavin biosynthesis pyrimidine reductase